MVSEPECRQVAIPGRARNSAKEALHRNAKQGGTASIFVALGFQGRLLFFDIRYKIEDIRYSSFCFFYLISHILYLVYLRYKI